MGLARAAVKGCSGLAVLAATLFGSARARGEDVAKCPAMQGGARALAEVDNEARLRFVANVLHEQAGRARTWTWAWGIAGVALIGEGLVFAALTTNKEDRVDSIVGASTSVLIPLALLVKPLRVMSDSRSLEHLVEEARGQIDCALLARAEELFVRSAEDEALGRSWIAHTIAIGGNIAIGLTLGLGFGHWKGAALNGGGGIVISELQIFTQPIGAVDALERYKAGRLGAVARGPSFRIVPLRGAFGAALSVTY